MTSPIEAQFLRLKKEAEERESKRAANGEIEELYKQLTSLREVKKWVDGFDFKNQSTAYLLEIILGGALANRVSDVHLEPGASDVKIRYRVDGLLYDTASFSLDFYKLIINRVKFLSNLKLNITDKPQDGRFTIKLAARNIDIRVSIVPSEYGETAVLRLLDPDALIVSLEELGLRSDDSAIVQEELAAPNGMILNTGPTGSGKTTTLYAFLKKKQTSEIKIITIEDPIEYHLGGIEQTQVTSNGNYNFANGLRSILRQDPDVILIGEIRDQETAEIAIQAALTGHLVFSTIHANEAAGAIPRLLDLNVKASSIGPSLSLIMAQRLARRLCPDCKKAKEISSETKEWIDSFLAALPERAKENGPFQMFEPGGCDKCNHLGYKGRVGIFELLKVDEKIENLIEKQASETEIQSFAIANGMVTMQQDGILKALRGITTLEEVERVAGIIKRH